MLCFSPVLEGLSTAKWAGPSESVSSILGIAKPGVVMLPTRSVRRGTAMIDYAQLPHSALGEDKSRLVEVSKTGWTMVDASKSERSFELRWWKAIMKNSRLEYRRDVFVD